MHPHPRTTWRHVGLTTWHLIRHAYLSGASAPAVAARYGVSVSALRKRAQREGWTKRRYALTRLQDPTTAREGSPDGSPADTLSEAERLPGGAADSLVRPGTPEEQAFVRRLWPVPELYASVLARKALGLASVALRQGRALDAKRFAEAARAIGALDEDLPYTDHMPDPDKDAARDQQMIQFLGERAVRMALDLLRGEPLAPQYAAYAARFEAERAAEATSE